MSDVVIKVENLSKQYRLGVINHGTLAKDLQAWWAKKRGKEDPNSRIIIGKGEKSFAPTKLTPDLTLNPSPKGEGLEKLPVPTGKGSGERSKGLNGEGFYALKDINFEVCQGEVLGIIGANGAGKSTLLKILSRVTSPTSGSIKIKGRIGSLLEVGTGFHPELTGRENIYLNGAILGMKRWEIDRKLDEIIDFSGVERFIDTPVKRYSSGMYVRLAFAVAAHLDPEILVVDEVLAVGDAEFQKKCLGKMGDISKKEGRTVLFVSHNMAAVRQLCGRGILLEGGRMIFNSDINDVVERYLFNTAVCKKNINNNFLINDHVDADIIIKSIEYKDINGKIIDEFEINKSYYIDILFNTKKTTQGKYRIGISVYNDLINPIVVYAVEIDFSDAFCLSEEHKIRIKILNQISPGNYMMDINVRRLSENINSVKGITYVVSKEPFSFKIQKGIFQGIGNLII